MIDFLHRTGRSGYAGNEGKIVKIKGRGSNAAREVRRKISAFAHRLLELRCTTSRLALEAGPKESMFH